MTDTTERKPEWLKLPPIPAQLRDDLARLDLSDPDTWGVLIVGACETEMERLTAQVAQLADALAAERARCDEIAGFVREHRARIHRPTCMDGNGCRCGLADLPMWGERDERRGVRA